MKIAFAVLAFAGACIAYAQLSTQVRTAGPILGGPFDAGIVTGRPFTADVLVENRQTLTDGSQVVNQQMVAAARDSQGRMRRAEASDARVGIGAANRSTSTAFQHVGHGDGPDGARGLEDGIAGGADHRGSACGWKPHYVYYSGGRHRQPESAGDHGGALVFAVITNHPPVHAFRSP